MRRTVVAPVLVTERTRAAPPPPPRPRRERALVRAAQHGDAEAFGELFRAHWPAAHRAAWLIVRDERLAEDVAQDAFVAMAGAIDRFDLRRPLGPWLKTIVSRKAIDAARKVAVRREVGDEALGAVAAAPDRGLPDGELLAAVGALPLEQRAVVVMRHVLGMRPAEIAAVLGVPRGTVNSRLRRGLDTLEGAL